MARPRKSPLPPKSQDLVLSHLARPMLDRLKRQYELSGLGMDFHIWVAQRVEVDIVIPFFNASQTPGVNAPDEGKP
jgi:hypothetical protein